MPPEAPPAATETAPPPADPAGATGAADNGANGNGSKTFTQDDLDRIVRERISRERSKFDGYDDLKRKAEEFDRIQEANKSELEKATARAAKEAADKTRAEADATWAGRIIRSEVRVAAAGKLADPEDAVRFIELDKFKVDQNGDVDTKSIGDAITELLTKKPYLAANGTQRRPDFDAGTRTPASGGEDMNSIIRRAVGRG